MENFKSKYFNINNFGDNWKKEELIPILNFLESTDLQTLQKITTECGVRFQGGNENMNDREQIIIILFGHDVKKEKLLEARREFY